MKKRNQQFGFTLMELVTVIAILSSLLLFLVKINFSGNDASQSIKLAIKMLAANFDNARTQAISHNFSTCLAIDTDVNSKYQYRRIAIYYIQNNIWKLQQIVILPERTFVIPFTNLTTIFTSLSSQSSYTYLEGECSINGEDISCYYFEFNNGGIMSKGGRLIGVGYGELDGSNVIIGEDGGVMGVFILGNGQQLILESKSAIEGILK
ncbi:MAG: prepilin-type N-terminal cleavage/methylation domain-containing protein [Puniceicoccales bacterium]|jgi:prepilin-type N-terminal cleavage/methylation domain-containing protein|nr:prepilin-type N-terminal cleavage/methylation domain-containing protein [Puniceicoccales bacterium]